ncbi:uncharacterized protein si:dkey-28n18.9 isoform X2 [Brienomyrus brachyistius]|nr:uncharacterized protein si:dkey-28n18.9 isoform X2 [Brienomyrus brachyistius]
MRRLATSSLRWEARMRSHLGNALPTTTANMMDGAPEVSVSGFNLSVSSIKVTEVIKRENSLVFVVRAQELPSNKQHCVDRKFEDFEWLQQCLLMPDGPPGLQGIIFPPLPAKPCVFQSNTREKMIKQLGLLGLDDDWKAYCMALEIYLQLVVSHTTLGKNQALWSFFTQNQGPGGQAGRQGMLNRLSQALEEIKKENHQDVDEFFQNERARNSSLIRLTKATTERLIAVVRTQQNIALACGHFSTTLHLGVGPDEDPTAKTFSKLSLKLSEIINIVKKNYECVAENNLNTFGLGLDLVSRYEESEKEMLFRRTCKLVELEHNSKNLEKAKSAKKANMEEIKKVTEKEFRQISDIASVEIQKLHRVRVEIFQKSLTSWCERQLHRARETSSVLSQHLRAFKQLDNTE